MKKFILHIFWYIKQSTCSLPVAMLVTQSCPTLCNPMDCSLPGFSIHRISQARKLEWIAISSSKGSSQPKDQTQVSRVGRQILYC